LLPRSSPHRAVTAYGSARASSRPRDVVGEIDQLGDGVSRLHLGDRVADMTVLGSNATYRTLRADHLTRVPTGVDAAEAASASSARR
jgi:NADPH:quinone reductase-like Zn-dependent oxidoreductase